VVTWEEVRHQAAISGGLTNSQTGKAIGGAQARITAGPPEFTNLLTLLAAQHGNRWSALRERLDRTRTDPDGHFHFLDLPNGQYTLEVSLPGQGSRYGTAQITAQVSRDFDGNINRAVVNPAIQPTTVRGRVINQDADPVVMAEVRVQGSGERALTDSQGNYRLLGVETGNRTVVVSAQGYSSLSRRVSINQAGAEQVLDFTLFSPLVSPLDIAGCRLWLRADSITGLSDNALVSSWPDSSGQGNHATQDTKNDRPAYQTSVINANPAIRFDGINGFLELPLSEPSTDHTFFFVYEHTLAGGGNNYLFDAQQGRLALDAASSGAPRWVRWDDGSQHEIAPALPGWQILTWVFSGTTGEVFRNGSSLGTDTYAPKSIGGDVALGANYRGSASSFRGDIAEVLYYNRALPAAQREQIERYLSNRYSIPFA
jgi:hypothetical protein